MQRLLVLLAGLLLLTLFGCGDTATAENDWAGLNPERVVVIGPSTTETIFKLGAGDRIVGVSDFCREPKAAKIARVGGQFDPNLERIAALDPDMVITQGDNQSLRDLCSRLKIPFLSFKTDSVDSWLDEVRQLGELFEFDRADQYAVDFRQDFHKYFNIYREYNPKVAVLIGRNGVDGMIAVGGGSFLNELLTAAGGKNVFGSNSEAYFNLSQEALLNAAPEVLIDLTIPTDSDPQKVASPSNEQALQDFGAAFPTLPAVQNKKVFVLNDDFIFLPGPRMLQTVHAFHNCVFSD